MAFFSKRKLSPIERFESALKDKHVAREKLTDRLRTAETALGELRVAATRLAMAGATDAQLDWAEADMRAAEDRTKTLRTALAQLDEQIATIKRELADAKTQRDREIVAPGEVDSTSRGGGAAKARPAGDAALSISRSS